MFLSLLGLICFFNTRLCGWLSTENILGFAVNLLVQLLYLLLNLHLLLPLLSSPPGCSLPGLNRGSATSSPVQQRLKPSLSRD